MKSRTTMTREKKDSSHKGDSFEKNTEGMTLHMLCMEGDLDRIVSDLSKRARRKSSVVLKVIDLLIGLSLKGYEGRNTGTIFLIGDVEGVQKNTKSMIINPFRGWRDINIMDKRQVLTFEAFSQLDGALLIDSRGYAHSAGRMILTKGTSGESRFDDAPKCKDRGGAGTRWRASRYITERTNTVAVTLSSRGDISVFERGKEIGRVERRICQRKKNDSVLLPDNSGSTSRIQ